MVSGGQQKDSAIPTRVSTLLQAPFPPRLPRDTERSSTGQSAAQHFLFTRFKFCCCRSDSSIWYDLNRADFVIVNFTDRLKLFGWEVIQILFCAPYLLFIL